VEFNWGNSKYDSSVKISIYDLDKVVRSQVTLKYENLMHNNYHAKNTECEQRLSSKFKKLSDYYDYYSDQYYFQYLIGYIFFLFIVFKFLRNIFRIIRLTLGKKAKNKKE
jgi:hypothetical protein